MARREYKSFREFVLCNVETGLPSAHTVSVKDVTSRAKASGSPTPALQGDWQPRTVTAALQAILQAKAAYRDAHRNPTAPHFLGCALRDAPLDDVPPLTRKGHGTFEEFARTHIDTGLRLDNCLPVADVIRRAKAENAPLPASASTWNANAVVAALRTCLHREPDLERPLVLRGCALRAVPAAARVDEPSSPGWTQQQYALASFLRRWVHPGGGDEWVTASDVLERASMHGVAMPTKASALHVLDRVLGPATSVKAGEKRIRNVYKGHRMAPASAWR